AAPAHQRAPRRDEPGRPAAGAPELRRGVPAPRAGLHAPPQGEGGDQRLGADQRLAGEHVDREADRVRPLLHRALESRLRSEDPAADPLVRLPHQPQRALSALLAWLLWALTAGLAASITLSETTLVALAVLLVVVPRAARPRVVWPLLGPLAAFALWTLVTALASERPAESLLASRGLLTLGAFYVVLNALPDGRAAGRFASGLLLAVGIVSVLSMVQVGLCPASGTIES